jgi:hypothetical protein
MHFNNSRIPSAITGLSLLSASVLMLGVPTITLARAVNNGALTLCLGLSILQAIKIKNFLGQTHQP